ncbi:MAG: aminopeptidase, partial [Proteobacteria bacterium]|nr:aminopeptidase [Pseudomonadota bacterium]
MPIVKMDKLTQGARKLVQHNGRVKPDEKVLIITDPSLQPIAELVTAEAKSVGAETVLVVM